MSTRSPCRLHVILATDASVGVILRRGPSRWVRLIKWNTKSDTFEYGQWFHGRIYEDSCDLSPDGSKFAYFATKYNKRTMAETYVALHSKGKEANEAITFAWTALSRPPYLTALALWPSDGSTWHGGTFFQDDWNLKLDLASGRTEPHPDHRPSTKLKTEISAGVSEMRMNSHGWVSVDRIWERKRPTGKYTIEFDSSYKRYSIVKAQQDGDQFELKRDEQSGLPYSIRGLPVDDKNHFELAKHHSRWRLHLKHCTWADWDHKGHLVFASGGKLFRSKVDRHGIAAPREIADFNSMEPEEIEAPEWAKRWV